MYHELGFKTFKKYIETQLEKHEKLLDKILSKSHKRCNPDVISEINIKAAKEKGAIKAYKKVIDFMEKNI